MTMWMQDKRYRIVAFISIVVSVVAITAFALTPSSVFGHAAPNVGSWFAPFTQASQASLPNYYAEGMVLQRDKPIAVHGTTDPNATITLTIQDGDKDVSKATVQADANGYFNAQAAAVPARLEPYSLTVASGKTTLRTINTVYVGDVFVAAGQSNMDLNYNSHYKSADDAAKNMQNVITKSDLPDTIDDENVRFIVTRDVPSSNTNETDLPLETFNSDGWVSATSASSPDLGYLPQFFAENVRQQEKDIPVGIIHIAWDGTYISRHVQGGDIYNNHVAPLAGFNVAGILWYQGESDAIIQSTALSYSAYFTKLINQYRQVFNQDDLPFLYVQLARYAGYPETSTVRQAQLDTLSAVANTKNVAMTVSIDSDKGTSELIHPLGKDILGYRMAQQWLAIQQKAAIPQGPIAISAKEKSAGDPSVAVVSFADDTATDLQTRQPIYSTFATSENVSVQVGMKLEGFEAASDNGVFVPAEAAIVGDTVEVQAEGLNSIREVRYLWSLNPNSRSMLYNGDLLPASPFTVTVQHHDDGTSE